jgi:hypothetical protein
MEKFTYEYMNSFPRLAISMYTFVLLHKIPIYMESNFIVNPHTSLRYLIKSPPPPPGDQDPKFPKSSSFLNLDFKLRLCLKKEKKNSLKTWIGIWNRFPTTTLALRLIGGYSSNTLVWPGVREYFTLRAPSVAEFCILLANLLRVRVWSYIWFQGKRDKN